MNNTCDICNILNIFVKCYWTSLDMRGRKSSALQVYIKLCTLFNPIKYVIFMSAFAWLISLVPLLVGSGQCLFFFPRLLVSACRFSWIFPSKWRQGKVFQPSLATSVRD